MADQWISQELVARSCAGLAALAFLFGAQARLTSRFTPEFHEEQKNKTDESQGAVYKNLGISSGTLTYLMGIFNIVLAGGLLFPGTRRLTAGLALIYMCGGVRGRWVTGRSIGPPVVVMAILCGALI